MQKSFIETQFPVSKLSKESYKERKANYSQTLTGLGKWWGRKPLILVRATILGLLIPASDNPKKDREIFLKILTMDNEGLWRRKNKSITVADLFEALPNEDREQYFEQTGRSGSVKFKRGVTPEEREVLQRKVFESYTYDEKLELCCRPEHLNGPDEITWSDINAHLGTKASSLPELMRELGKQKFGRIPRIGDAFCGGGSIPFEAARIGCDAFGSDLNPIAALLTWASLHILGGGGDEAEVVSRAQQMVYKAVDRQVSEWGIEHNEDGWRADAYLYCTETRCPECGWMIPLAPSWVIGEKTLTWAKLIPDIDNKRFSIEIISGASTDAIKKAKRGTISNSELVCPNPECGIKTPISTLRGDRRTAKGTITNLRMWGKDDITSNSTDIFQERLYCVRWVESYLNENNELKARRWYRSVTPSDTKREEKVFRLLSERLEEWQMNGYVPCSLIEPGNKTDEPIRTRGWTHWHHLFNPRQMLILGTFMQAINAIKGSKGYLPCLMAISKCLDRNSKLCLWDSSAANEKVANTFLNQAFNPTYNYGVRTVTSLNTAWFYDLSYENIPSKADVSVGDARTINTICDYWVTDPPYADAVNYHELSEFFLAWYEKHIQKIFSEWYSDSKRALAVKGNDESFRRSMIDCYRNLALQMSNDGMQVVMFTHQDAGVWADLALILWAAGLQVTSAWTIATETDVAGYKKGNYVQGTVLLVLRKRTSEEIAFLDDITHEIRPEVERQLQSMLEIEDKDDPNFSDSDYQLAAYAAALRVLTSYKQIEDLDVERELSRNRRRGDISPIQTIIENGVKIASNFLIPRALHDDEIIRRDLWRNLTPEERFYLKGLEVESHGDYRQGVYQEFAKGFGLREYTNMLESGKANETRLKTAGEFKRREMGTPGFGSTLLRNILFAIYKTGETERTDEAMRWLKDEIPGDYWQQKQTIVAILRYISRLPIQHWTNDAHWAGILAGAVENDGV